MSFSFPDPSARWMTSPCQLLVDCALGDSVTCVDHVHVINVFSGAAALSAIAVDRQRCRGGFPHCGLGGRADSLVSAGPRLRRIGDPSQTLKSTDVQHTGIPRNEVHADGRLSPGGVGASLRHSGIFPLITCICANASHREFTVRKHPKHHGCLRVSWAPHSWRPCR